MDLSMQEVHHMLKIGENVFYPMQGAGEVAAIEEKEILGETKLYYIIKFPHRSMEVMVPVGKEGNLGIRKVVDSGVLEDVLAMFNQGETENNVHQSQRYRVNMNKIKSGNIYEGAEVIRDLKRMSLKRSLGYQDKNLLNNAQEILISELILVKGLEQKEAETLLDQVMNS
jgi:CarD family transcriptional regulator